MRSRHPGTLPPKWRRAKRNVKRRQECRALKIAGALIAVPAAIMLIVFLLTLWRDG